MRFVYGASAVAALSVMTVGLVQPGFEVAPVEAAPDGVGALAAAQAPGIQVRHVIRYVQLRPGEQAPPGATVIRSESQPRSRDSAQPGAMARSQTGQQPASTTPRQQPAPRATTRQSGR